MRVKIIGNGNWGTALGKLLLENGHDISYWQNNEIIDNTEIILLVVPTQALRSVLPKIVTKDLIIINCAKGIENTTHKLPFQIVEEILGKTNYFSLIGPSFADEVKGEMPTLVNLGFRDEESVEQVKKLFQTPRKPL